VLVAVGAAADVPSSSSSSFAADAIAADTMSIDTSRATSLAAVVGNVVPASLSSAAATALAGADQAVATVASALARAPAHGAADHRAAGDVATVVSNHAIGIDTVHSQTLLEVVISEAARHGLEFRTAIALKKAVDIVTMQADGAAALAQMFEHMTELPDLQLLGMGFARIAVPRSVSAPLAEAAVSSSLPQSSLPSFISLSTSSLSSAAPSAPAESERMPPQLVAFASSLARGASGEAAGLDAMRVAADGTSGFGTGGIDRSWLRVPHPMRAGIVLDIPHALLIDELRRYIPPGLPPDVAQVLHTALLVILDSICPSTFICDHLFPSHCG
jgi:hypothetical protein